MTELKLGMGQTIQIKANGDGVVIRLGETTEDSPFFYAFLSKEEAELLKAAVSVALSDEPKKANA